MDFTGQFQFSGSHSQAYQPFIPLAPPTPSHSNSCPSDDYNNNSPPVSHPSVINHRLHPSFPPPCSNNTDPDRPRLTPPVQDAFDNLPAANDPQFPGFDRFDYPQQSFHNPSPQQQHQPNHHHNSAFSAAEPPCPPTPPNQPSFAQQQQPPQQPSTNGAFNGIDHQMAADVTAQSKFDHDDLSNGRGGSEDDNLTPAQSKRKAQNRAAQRAFRERKEKHVKDLESKLAGLEAAQEHASAENDRLRRDLQKITTENEILKATSTTSSGGGSHHAASHPSETMTTGPMRYSPTEFASDVLSGHNNKTFSHRIVESADGQRLLAAGATWDFIISHDLFKRGLVDIGAVSEHLKTRAICDGQGPVFSEKDVTQAIELSVASGTDDLL